MRDTEREAETKAEGEAGSMQGAGCGTHPRTPGSQPDPEVMSEWLSEPKADTQPLSHPGTPKLIL